MSARPSKQQTAAPVSVLYVLHNHPAQAAGGTEIFGYNLFQQVQAEGNAAFLLAGTGKRHGMPHGGTAFRAVDDKQNEMLYWGEGFDFFTQSTRAPLLLAYEFARLLKDLNPQVVHFQHSLRFGVEALSVVRQVLPQAKIVYTLHEYIPICHRDGMMVRKTDESLCDSATPKRCNECFPERSIAQFAVRERFIKSQFALVDAFIAPSEFLKARYVAWGLPEAKIQVIANGHVPRKPVEVKDKGSAKNRFAYFGQISPYKGVMELLAAMRQMNDSDTVLDIYGGIGQQSEAFRRAFEEAVASSRGNVTYHGAYEAEELPRLMAQADWVVAPSRWWENAPLVIDEAFMHGRPVICSGIGGMKEKVTDGVNGLYVEPGSVESLVTVLQRASGNVALWHRLTRGITAPRGIKECVAEHINLYQSLLT